MLITLLVRATELNIDRWKCMLLVPGSQNQVVIIASPRVRPADRADMERWASECGHPLAWVI